MTFAAITQDYAEEERAKRQTAEARKAEREEAKAAEAEIEGEREKHKRELAARLAALPKEKLKALRRAFAKEITADAMAEPSPPTSKPKSPSAKFSMISGAL